MRVGGVYEYAWGVSAGFSVQMHKGNNGNIVHNWTWAVDMCIGLVLGLRSVSEAVRMIGM